MMKGALNRLLDQYPRSSIKAEAERILRKAEIQSTRDRSVRALAYDVIYAFQRLEARRLGIRSDRNPDQYFDFRRGFIAALAMWVPGKDPYIDGLREALTIAVKHNDPELESLLHTLMRAEEGRTSMEQSRRAASPRKEKLIDGYIRRLLTQKPTMTLSDLWDQMYRDEHGEVIEIIEPDQVYVSGVQKPYPRGSIRKRYYEIRKKLRSQ